MAAIAGKGGKVTLSTNDVANITTWSVDLEFGMTDITALGDNWKEQLPTLKGWTGSFEGSWDAEDDTSGQVALQTAALANTKVALRFYVNSTNYYSGNAYITGMSVETPVDDKVSISFDFIGDGAVSYT